MSDKSSIKYILSLSIPIFFANLATPLVGIVDTTLMGNMNNQGYLTATSIASSFFSMSSKVAEPYISGSLEPNKFRFGPFSNMNLDIFSVFFTILENFRP